MRSMPPPLRHARPSSRSEWREPQRSRGRSASGRGPRRALQLLTWLVLVGLLASVLGHLVGVEHRVGLAGVEHVDDCHLSDTGAGKVSLGCEHEHEHQLCPLLGLRSHRSAPTPLSIGRTIGPADLPALPLPAAACPGSVLARAPKTSPPGLTGAGSLARSPRAAPPEV